MISLQDVTWAPWHLKLPTTRMLFNSVCWLLIKETSKLWITGSSWGESVIDRWIPLLYKGPVMQKALLWREPQGLTQLSLLPQIGARELCQHLFHILADKSHGGSNYRQLICLFKRLSKLTPKNSSKLRLTGLLWGWTDLTKRHYSDVTMGAMASKITSLTIVYPTVYSGAGQRKHQSSASRAFVVTGDRWIPRIKGQ